MITIGTPESPIQVIEQPQNDLLEGIIATSEKTIGSVVYEVTLNFPPLASMLDVPASFVKGLEDCAEGRTVDMEVAMSERPPDRAL